MKRTSEPLRSVIAVLLWLASWNSTSGRPSSGSVTRVMVASSWVASA